MAIIFAEGPPVSKVSKARAEAALAEDKRFPDGTQIHVQELKGHWVAAVVTADEFGSPSDSDEEAPGPKSEGPDDSKPEPPSGDGDGDSDDGGPPSDGGGDKPPHEHKDGPPGAGGSEGHEIKALLDIVSQIAEALGLPIGVGGSPVPGVDGPPGPPGPAGGPPPGPPGAGGPPGGPPHGGPDQEVKHERTMKPGEAPPGTTPVGAPAFASVNGEPHPWANLIGVTATFEVEERIPDDYTLSHVDNELRELAQGTGFKVKQIVEGRNDQGHRIARALISSY